MSMDDRMRHASPRREKATRGAFFVWIATYAVVAITLITVHGLAGTPPRSAGMQARHGGAEIDQLDPTPVGAIHPVTRAGKGG
jgi:hypothetical protein